MKPKTVKIGYLISTGIFVALLLADGLAGVLQIEGGQKSLLALGYPMYLLFIVGGAKILAAYSILQTKWKTIKEWAFAGYTINCIGASASHAFSHHSLFLILLPALFFGVMLVPYIFWKRILETNNA
jgi:hypothetical protein